MHAIPKNCNKYNTSKCTLPKALINELKLRISIFQLSVTTCYIYRITCGNIVKITQNLQFNARWIRIRVFRHQGTMFDLLAYIVIGNIDSLFNQKLEYQYWQFKTKLATNYCQCLCGEWQYKIVCQYHQCDIQIIRYSKYDIFRRRD